MEPTTPIPEIFINYRRDDTGHAAVRLYDHLASRYGEDQVFMDIESLGPGVDFPREIERMAGGCKALLALIGPGWLKAAYEDGRLKDPDWARQEIEVALKHDTVVVIPVLVDRAPMPRRQDLPGELAPLADRNAFRYTLPTSRSDLARLLTEVDKVLNPRPPEPRQDPTRAAKWLSTPVRTFAHPLDPDASQRILGVDWITSVAFSPDARRLATASNGENTARMWDTHTGNQRQIFKHAARSLDNVNSVAFGLDGRWLATGSGSDNTARIWNSQTGQPLHELDHGSLVHAVAFSPDGRWLATGSSDNLARIWDAHSGQQQPHPLRHDGWVLAVAFSPDGRWLATGSKDNQARIWDTDTGSQQLSPYAREEKVNAVAFSPPDGRWLATGSDDHTARIWDANTSEELQHLPHNSAVNAVAFSHDGRWLATGSWDKTVRIWDTNTGKQVHFLTHDDGVHGVHAVAFSQDDRWLVTGTDANLAVLWALTPPSH